MMSIEEEDDASLKELVTKTLQTNGILGKIQAQLRASVFLALEEEFRDKSIPLVSPSSRQVLGTQEGALAASLVQDFLQCLGLDFSLAVFTPESGHPTLCSLLGRDTLASSLGLAREKEGLDTADEKGQRSPLLIELLKEKNLQPISVPGVSVEQNGEDSSIASDTTSNGEDHHQHHPHPHPHPHHTQEAHRLPKPSDNHVEAPRSAEDTQEESKARLPPPALPPMTLENGKKENEVTTGPGKDAKISLSGNTWPPRASDPPSPDDSRPASDTSLSGEDKQYEDDFSSLSEKDGQDEDEEEGEDVEEDIEEDLGDVSVDDLLNSSASGVSDVTKDQSLSQASSVPAFQEEL